MSSILLTGAAGFIGSHVAEKLLLRGEQVVGIDNLNDYYPVEFKERNLRILAAFPNFRFERIDISSRPCVEKLFREHRFSHIAHLAARAGVRPSIADPFIYEQTNVQGTLHLLEAARSVSTVENFVLTSSSSVYGNSVKAPFREDDHATDFPISPYAATKKATEILAYTYHHLYGMNVNVVRPFTVYGPRGRPDMAPWIFLESALKGKAIHRFGDGSSSRDYTYIADFVEGFVSALDTPLGYEIFNLGNSETVSLRDMLKIVEKVTGRQLKIEARPMQPGDVTLTSADITKARQKLGYAPKTGFELGFALFHQWFLEMQNKQNKWKDESYVTV